MLCFRQHNNARISNCLNHVTTGVPNVRRCDWLFDMHDVIHSMAHFPNIVRRPRLEKICPMLSIDGRNFRLVGKEAHTFVTFDWTRRETVDAGSRRFRIRHDRRRTGSRLLQPEIVVAGNRRRRKAAMLEGGRGRLRSRRRSEMGQQKRRRWGAQFKAIIF